MWNLRMILYNDHDLVTSYYTKILASNEVHIFLRPVVHLFRPLKQVALLPLSPQNFAGRHSPDCYYWLQGIKLWLLPVLQCHNIPSKVRENRSSGLRVEMRHLCTHIGGVIISEASYFNIKVEWRLIKSCFPFLFNNNSKVKEYRGH